MIIIYQRFNSIYLVKYDMRLYQRNCIMNGNNWMDAVYSNWRFGIRISFSNPIEDIDCFRGAKVTKSRRTYIVSIFWFTRILKNYVME